MNNSHENIPDTCGTVPHDMMYVLKYLQQVRPLGGIVHSSQPCGRDGIRFGHAFDRGKIQGGVGWFGWLEGAFVCVCVLHKS